MLKYWKDRVLSEQGETGVVQLLLLEPGNRPFAAGAMWRNFFQKKVFLMEQK